MEHLHALVREVDLKPDEGLVGGRLARMGRHPNRLSGCWAVWPYGQAMKKALADGQRWCWLVLAGAGWCWLVLAYADWC